MIELIKAATLSQQKQTRVKAQAELLTLRTAQTQSFFLQTVNIFKTQSIPSDIRQAAGAILASSILFQINYICLWDSLTPSSKNVVKDGVLSVMVDGDRSVRRAAANVVAAICCIQIPRKEWPGIIQKISSNINNQNFNVKEVSILALGFICQRLKSKEGFTFDYALQESIVTGILLGVNEQNKQIKQTALKALRDSIASVPNIFERAQYRDYLIKQVAQILATSPQSKSLALQILAELAKWSYLYLGDYLHGFYLLLDPIMRNTSEQNQENCILAIQFWESLSQEFKNSQNQSAGYVNYLQGELGEKIVTILLQNLCIVEEGDDDDGNTIADSAGKCLQTIFQGDSKPFQKLVLTFTENTLKRDDWKLRQASIRAFALLLLGLPSYRSQQLVKVSLLQLISLLNDPVQAVQLSCLKSLNLITEDAALAFLNHQKFYSILQLIVTKLPHSSSFLRQVCSIINNLCMYCELAQLTNFQTISDKLIQILFQQSMIANRTNDDISRCIITIIHLITAGQNSQVARNNIQFVLTHFESCRTLPQEKRQLFYSSFLTILQTSLQALRKQTIPIDTLSQIYTLVVNYFTTLKDVDSDGLYVVSALSFFFRNDRRLVDDFWKYIEHALTKYQEAIVFKSVISCVCDFSANYGDLIKDKLEPIFKEFIGIFDKNLITREMKLDVLMCIGQVFLHCRQMCLPYLSNVMDLILICCDASIKMTVSDFAYSQQLKETIIETLTCILHGLSQQGATCKEMVPYINNVFQFVKLTCQKSCRPKLTYVKSCALLLADFSNFYRSDTRKYKNQPFILQIIQTLQKYNKDGSMTKEINYIKSKL